MSTNSPQRHAETAAASLSTREIANALDAVQEAAAVAPISPHRPDRIGPYHILELIDTGGMGEVYKAERRSPMRQLVAIKIIKLGFDTREVIARFESERQALARMDHPHVAKVLDAGTTDSGRPYFVMEYVAGVPITKFADDNKLTIKDRLLLFTQVCEAISHAHTKAIIHRDIKSGNVLAYMHDGKPTVKVIDFGIAKALTGDRLTERTFNTDRSHVVGTWETMSPEQAEGSPDIDTRTDVYSLGVLLYELLTGAKPFDRETLARAADEEIRRIIREVEPPRPSTRLTSLGAGATKVAALRRQQLDALARELRSELEWIPLKAMRKERDRRYVSAHQIAEDIQNYLEHHPLIAGPESRVYRLRKFLKRNKGPVAAVTAVVVVLMLGVAVSAAFYIRAERHKLEETRTLTEFLGFWNEQAILNTSSGDLPEAESRLREGVDRARRKLGPNDPTSLALLNNLALVLKKQGRLEDAEPMYRDVLERRRRVLGNDAVDTIYSLNNLGGLLLERARRDRDSRWLIDAEPVLHDAYARVGLLEDSNPLRATVINNYATLLRIRGKRKEAEPLFQQVLDLRRRFLPANHPNTLDSLYVLATLLQQLDRNAEAEPLFAELYQRVPAAQIQPATANIYMSRWGTCLVQLGRFSEAEEPLLEAYRRLNAGQRESIAIREVVTALIEMYTKTGRADEAARWGAELAKLQPATQPAAALTAAPRVGAATQPE